MNKHSAMYRQFYKDVDNTVAGSERLVIMAQGWKKKLGHTKQMLRRDQFVIENLVDA